VKWLALLCFTTLQAQNVRIEVFGLFRPAELIVAPAEDSVLRVEARGFETTLEGNVPFKLTPDLAPAVVTPVKGALRLSVPGKITRRFEGRLEIRRGARSLEAIVTMPLETAVVSVVAAESVPGASIEALKAQAVAARSYYTAGARHTGAFEFCDTTHCQFLRHPPAPGELAARATTETGGLVLTYDGETLPALYSARCGGQTQQLQDRAYLYRAIACRRCSGKTRAGHGIGLCQEGAASLAREGFSFRQILEWYYPGTKVISPSIFTR
jgi:peptidoglycan hydrolase-like amidase